MASVENFVEMLDESDGFQILAPAEGIRNPLTRLARVVEVEHRGDCVHPQSVDVIFVDPEERIRDQIILDFVAAVIEYECSPIGMCAFSWVGVLVKMRAVEKC